MSLILTNSDLGDIPTSLLTPDFPHFPAVTKHKVSGAINKLPKKKAEVVENTPNELLKIERDTITPHLTIISNTCLKTHHFPPPTMEGGTHKNHQEGWERRLHGSQCISAHSTTKHSG
ncbi:hypothetical protein O181_096564 [Austropuccinia psidii MF-1]|uniref:Uncharacterized protein n=1 Tax=Austropuccinia psidii MF-1 TaxID=1389203 RepID=A0A9Q3PCT0_9BASI|nr:hypothetical protein [Austropuccinia psidii MF-1]